MTKIALINLPGSSVRRGEEHNGLAILHSFLNKKGYSTEIFDAYARGNKVEELIAQVQDWCLNDIGSKKIIGVSPYVTSYPELVKFGETLKKEFPHIKIILGGHFGTLHHSLLIKDLQWIDGIIAGEGEYTLLELCQKENWENITGFYNGKNQFIKRKRIIELDELPFQTRYLSKEELQGQPYSLVTSRGCFGNCSFCSMLSFYSHNEGPIQTARSAKNVADEMELLAKKYDARSFKIVDDNFFRINDVENKFLKELKTEIKKRGLKPLIRLSARPDDITEERAKLLKDIGVQVIAIGGESSIEKSLELFNKNITVEITEKSIAILKKHNIKVLLNFIVFDPTLSFEDLKQNFEFIKKYSKDVIFHRINSHLWLRNTDPIVKKLIKLGLVSEEGFPYVDYRYRDLKVEKVKILFDNYCNQNMKAYYSAVDPLMAPDSLIEKNQWELYQKIISEDLSIVKNILNMTEREYSPKEVVKTESRNSDKYLLV
ncbi:MAG: B12-binding domain-containing radical SAM protein [Fusobacteriaceae bacterium]